MVTVTAAVAVAVFAVFLTFSASTVALRPISKLHAALSPADADDVPLPGMRFTSAKITRAVPVTVTVEGVGAGAAVTVAAASAQHCTLSLHSAGEGAVSVANLAVELRACAALKAALGLDAASTGLDALAAAWVHDVTVAGVDAPYAHDGNVAGVADGTAITVRIRALNRLRAHLHTRAGNAVDGRGPRVCGYGLNGAYAFSVAAARECARVLKPDIVHAEQALGHAWMADGDVTYTFNIADVAANSPGDGGQIGNDVTLHIHEPVCVELNRHSAGADPIRSCAWLTRAQLLNARWDDTLRGHINTAIGGDGSQNIDAAAANSVFVANNGAAVLDFTANTAVSLSYAIKVDYWPRGLGLAYFAADRPAGVVHNRLYDTTNGMHGGPNAEVVYINTCSGQTEANWAHVPGAVEAAVTAAGMARHQTNARTLYNVMVSTNAPDGDGAGHRAVPGGPSRVLNRLLLEQNGLPRSVHWGSAFVLVKVRATGSLGAAVHGVQSPVKEIGWIMGADNTGNGAGGHTEQRILEQLRLFVLALEAAVVHGTTLHVTDLSVRIITDWIPDFNDNSAFCYYDFKWTRLMAGAGYYRAAQYTNAIRTAQGVAGPNVPPTGAQANGNAANAAYPTRANLLARALAVYGPAGPVVAWSVTGDYLYAQANGAGNGQGQRQVEAFAEAGRNGRAIPNGADEAHGATIGYGNAYELHAGGAFAQALA